MEFCSGRCEGGKGGKCSPRRVDETHLARLGSFLADMHPPPSLSALAAVTLATANLCLDAAIDVSRCQAVAVDTWRTSLGSDILTMMRRRYPAPRENGQQHGLLVSRRREMSHRVRAQHVAWRTREGAGNGQALDRLAVGPRPQSREREPATSCGRARPRTSGRHDGTQQRHLA